MNDGLHDAPVTTIARSEAPGAVATPVRYQLVREGDLVASFGRPDTSSRVPGVLAVGGLDGGLPEYFLDLLVPQGFACLGVAYFGIEGTPASLMDIPLERLERALRWLAGNPGVEARGRVAVIGASRGGELALLLAATFPQLVGPVVAYTPSSVVWPGMDAGMQPAAASSWSVRGVGFPFVPYVDGAMPSMSERGLAVRPVFERALADPAAVREASIPVEQATGPLLLVSGGDDQVWPSERMCRMVVDRMAARGRAADVKHLNYPRAGHALFPYTGPSGVPVRTQVRLDFGGTPAADRAAHAAAWRHVVAHLRGAPVAASV